MTQEEFSLKILNQPLTRCHGDFRNILDQVPAVLHFKVKYVKNQALSNRKKRKKNSFPPPDPHSPPKALPHSSPNTTNQRLCWGLPWWGAQRGRIRLPVQETRVRSLIREDRTCLAHASEQRSLCTEDTVVRSQNTAAGESPLLPATREKPAQQRRPSTTKNK